MLATLLIFTAAVAAVCGISAFLLRLQPLEAEPGLVNRLAGFTIGHGFTLTRRLRLTGDRQLMAAATAAWLLWSVVGCAIIAVLWDGYAPQRLYLVYGIGCGVVGAVIAFFAAFFGSAWYAERINMSDFEGKRGYFVCFMGLLGAIVGLLAVGIPMTIYFFQAGRAMM